MKNLGEQTALATIHLIAKAHRELAANLRFGRQVMIQEPILSIKQRVQKCLRLEAWGEDQAPQPPAQQDSASG